MSGITNDIVTAILTGLSVVLVGFNLFVFSAGIRFRALFLVNYMTTKRQSLLRE